MSDAMNGTINALNTAIMMADRVIERTGDAYI